MSAPPTDGELMTILASVEKLNATLIEAFAMSMLSSMPRSKYLKFVRETEKLRAGKGL